MLTSDLLPFLWLEMRYCNVCTNVVFVIVRAVGAIGDVYVCFSSDYAAGCSSTFAWISWSM